MAKAYLRVTLEVRPTGGGAAELVPPPALEDVDYRYVVVKDGAAEGIVVIEETPAVVSRLQKAEGITKLTAKQLHNVRTGYPAPRMKQKVQTEEGRPVEETMQTVRSGFYLIDVPVNPQ